MTIRDQRQKEFANTWLSSGKFGILHLCPRFGKIRTTINILDTYPTDARVLIAYPDLKIKDAWESDFERWGYENDNVVFTTHMSLKKHTEDKFDLLVLDEIHLLSENQRDVVKSIINESEPDVLGLTGTLSRNTESDLSEDLGLFVVAEYPIEDAITDGVITDYEIVVVSVPLDNKVKQKYKDKERTEKAQFDAYTWVINKMEIDGRDSMFLRLSRMRVIQNSIAKVEMTKQLLSKHKDERVLVFCGITKIADSLGIPSYHSKSSEKNIFTDFAEGKGNHLAVVKIGNTGVTYRPLNRVIINYFDSNSENLAQKINRCMAMEYTNPDKKAYIYIISSDEEVEKKWLRKALEFFDHKKIKYVNSLVNAG